VIYISHRNADGHCGKREIAVGIVDEPSIGIDTPEDYARFVERMRRRVAA